MDIGKLIGLGKIDGLLGRIEKRPLHIYAGQCLSKRDSGTVCEKCWEQCPNEVIDLSSGVEVDFDRCSECGICVNICSTGVFESRLTEDYWLARVQTVAASGPVVGFACPKHAAGGAPAKGAAARVEVPCLGRVSETMLVGAAVFGARSIWLNVALCGDCDSREGLRLARQTVRSVDSLLEAWGRPLEFSLTAEPPNHLAFETVSGGESEGYDRRELLVKLKREAIAAGLGLAQGRIDTVSGIFDPPSPSNFAYRLPRKRELLLRLVKKLGQPASVEIDATGLSFCDLTIDASRCNFCGNCAQFCPTGALKAVRSETQAKILFQVSQCLACDLCARVCSPAALNISTAVNISAIYNEKERFLVDLSYHQCAKCRQPFAAAAKRDLCDFCRVREEKLQDDSWS